MPGRPPKLLDRESLMNYAARALTSRPLSLNELRDRLKRRAARQEDAAEVLARLKEAGFLNDRKLADSFANWRRENQGLGKARVMHDLMARRIAPAVAKQAVETAYSGVDEVALIDSLPGAEVSRQESRRAAGRAEATGLGVPPSARSRLQLRQFDSSVEALRRRGGAIGRNGRTRTSVRAMAVAATLQHLKNQLLVLRHLVQPRVHAHQHFHSGFDQLAGGFEAQVELGSALFSLLPALIG